MAKYHTTEEQLYVHNFEHPIWRIWTHVYWCKDRVRLWECLVANHDGPKTDINPIPSNCLGTVHTISRDGGKIVVVALPFEWQGTAEQYITISHEAIHASFAMHRILKMPLPTMYPESHTNDEEGICYLHDWIYEHILGVLMNQEDHKFKFANEEPFKDLEEPPKDLTASEYPVSDP